LKPNNSSLSSSPVEISAPHSIHPSRFSSVPNANTKIQTSSASASAAAAAATSIKSKPKLRLAYIGPQVTTSDSDNEADATFATLSRADQMAAYEKFKRDTRIQKIYEFHQQAAQFDIQLADNISNTPSDKSGTAIARLMTQHEQTMLRLRTDKEEERRKLVRDERNRMTVEIKKGAGLTKKVSSSAKTTIPVVPVPTKPPTPPLSTSYPDFNQLQSVLEYAPDMSLDAALQITQLISSDSHQAAHEGHTYLNNSGPRQRKDSISILDHTRFDTISAKGKQRPASTTTTTTTGPLNNFHPNGYWKPPVQPPSPQENEVMTDQFARILLDQGGAHGPMTQKGFDRDDGGDDDDEFFGGWGSGSVPLQLKKSTINTNTPQLSAWTKKPPNRQSFSSSSSLSSSSSPAVALTNGRGPTTTTKKTIGTLNNRNHHPQAQIQNPNDMNTAEEGVEFIPSSPEITTSKRGPSLLSNMMTRGRNAVAGAVGAALGPMNGSGSYPSPAATTAPHQPRKTTIQISTSPSPSITLSPKKTRQVVNKKPMSISTEPKEDEDEYESEDGLEPQPTPRAVANTTKFTSAWGSQNHLKSSSSSSSMTTSPSSSPSSNTFATSRARNHHHVVSGGVWDDISTTPKPCSLSTPNALGGLGQSGVKRPSGLHNQVWNAEEQVEEEGEEEDEDEDEEGDEFEDGWNFPGSLNTQRDHAASAAAKFGFGASSTGPPFSAMEKKHMAPPSSTSAWGFSTTTPSTTTTTTRTAPSHPKSTSASAFASRKHQVTMEEIPDESEYPSPHHHHHHHHHHQHSLGRSSNSLAYDSRAILEPKPTKPSSMLDDVIQFGSKSGTFISSIINTNSTNNNEDEEEEGKEEMDYHSVVEKHHPTFPRVVNPNSNPNANIPDIDIDPAVLQRAALQMRQGEERFGVAHAHAHANGAGLTTGTVKPKAKKKLTRVSLNRRRPPCGGDDEDQEEDGEEEDNEDVKPGFWTHTDTRKRWEESEEDLEREQGILNSRQKLEDLFGSGSGSVGGGGAAMINTKKPSVDKIVIPNPETDMPPLRGQALRALKEKEEAEEREREESLRQHQEQQQREAQEQDKKVNVVHPPSPPKAEKEKEKEGASKSTTTGGKGRAKKGKGKR